MFHRIHDMLRGAARFAVWLGGGSLMLCAVMITVDVLLRKFLSISMGGADEITAYAFAGATTWAFAYCLLNRANIRIDALYDRFPRGVRAGIDVLNLVMLIIFAGVLTERAFFALTESIANQTTSITPLGTRIWIPQSVWAAGWAFFLVTAIFLLMHVTRACLRGDLNDVTRIAGLRSVEEEVSDESRSFGASRSPGTGDSSC
ncbi:MAG: TRAP transporter small permease subunit [Acetobacteraceae bacterium]